MAAVVIFYTSDYICIIYTCFINKYVEGPLKHSKVLMAEFGSTNMCFYDSCKVDLGYKKCQYIFHNNFFREFQKNYMPDEQFYLYFINIDNIVWQYIQMNMLT